MGLALFVQIPVTFEESFIAFKTGLGYMMDMRASIPEAEDFFSSPLSSHSIISLLSAFAAKDKNFRILLLHLPPPEAAAVLSSNHREALQDSTWNAFIALWSFQELFGRLEVSSAMLLLLLLLWLLLLLFISCSCSCSSLFGVAVGIVSCFYPYSLFFSSCHHLMFCVYCFS